MNLTWSQISTTPGVYRLSGLRPGSELTLHRFISFRGGLVLITKLPLEANRVTLSHPSAWQGAEFELVGSLEIQSRKETEK